MSSYNTSSVLMVPPLGFTYNSQTAVTNTFQSKYQPQNLKQLVMTEFENMFNQLVAHDVNVLLLPQNEALPDAIFPNNWFSTHLNNLKQTDIILYPMMTQNRQDEVNLSGLIDVLNEQNISIGTVFDLRKQAHGVLEGTGSAVLDRKNNLIYASISPRTNLIMVNQLAKLLNYTPIVFTSYDCHQVPIYHTNVISSVLTDCAVFCLQSLLKKREQQKVLESLEKTRKKLISISHEQVSNMCGNILELKNKNGARLGVMSAQAKKNFNPPQIKQLENYAELIIVNIETIEKVGGGSARCMLAEIYH